MIKLNWRETVFESDPEKIRELTAKSNVFSSEEISVAGELAEEFLLKGEASGYHFLFAEDNEQLIAYTCFGMIPLTDKRFDLYWIVVDPHYQKQKLGAELLQRSEAIIAEMQGMHIYAETSGRADYIPARNFYSRNGYEKMAVFENFYKQGDDKVVYRKRLTVL